MGKFDYLGVPLSQVDNVGWEFRPLERIQEAMLKSWSAAKYFAGAGVGAVSELPGVQDVPSAQKFLQQTRDDLIMSAAKTFEDTMDMGLQHTDLYGIDSALDLGKWGLETLVGYMPDLAAMTVTGLTSGALTTGRASMMKIAEVAAQKGVAKHLKHIMEREGAEVATEAMKKEALKNMSRDMGAIFGVTGYEGMLGAGQDYQQDIETRGIELANPFTALASGAAQSMIAALNPLNRFLARGPKLGAKKINILEMTLGEAFEETSQELVSILHDSGLDPNQTFMELLQTEDSKKRLIESGVAGAFLGSVFGGGAHAIFPSKKVVDKEKETNVVKDIIENPEKTLSTLGIDTTQDAPDPTKTKPEERPDPNKLEGIDITHNVLVEGESVPVTMTAKEWLQHSDNEIEKWYVLRECLAL